MKKLFGRALALSLFLCLAGISTAPQDQGRMTIQATARGTGTQMGRVYNVTIIIEQFSTLDDRKALAEAFGRSGQEGLLETLEKMSAKGRVRFSSGGVGNDVKYIIELPSEKGRRIRLVTDRTLAWAEINGLTRSEQYTVGAMDLVLTPDGKGTGTLLPACKLKMDNKKQQLEIETFQNPWNLVNFTIHNG
jgi:hypothetical protein